MADPQVTVVIATIPGREQLLARARESAAAQTIPVNIEVELDAAGVGPAAPRNRAIARVTTPWIAFLDDDDTLRPFHCEALLAHATETGADLAWSQHDVRHGDRPPTNHPPALDFAPPGLDSLDVDNFIPITYLVRTDMVRKIGGFREGFCPEDHQFLIDLRNAGLVVSHLRRRTWIVSDHGLNTHGEPRRAWDYYEDTRSVFESEAQHRDVSTMGGQLAGKLDGKMTP